MRNLVEKSQICVQSKTFTHQKLFIDNVKEMRREIKLKSPYKQNAYK